MIKTRFAPSPTGYLHIGGARTALFSWLYTRKLGGKFLLRIEDSDLERSNSDAVSAILDSMSWLGLDYDEGPFYQTQRLDRYREILKKLLLEGKAYYCYCTRDELENLREKQRKQKIKPRYDGKHRNYVGPPRKGVNPVVRFKNPNDGEVILEDLIHGDIVFQNAELDDLIIARADGMPTYNFCVVVDDMDMGITHVIRGDDHINNTPRQINILKALNVPIPKYGHVPMILGPDGQKLSKRHGAASVMEYRDLGYLPEAILNYLVRLGWSHGDQEIFSLKEMINLFDLNTCKKAPSAINPSKLSWLNRHYLRTLDLAYISHHLKWHINQLGIDIHQGPYLDDVVKVFAHRSDNLKEMAKSAKFLYQDFEGYEPQAVDKNLRYPAEHALRKLYESLSELSEWHAEAINDVFKIVHKSTGLSLSKIAQPLRVVVSGTAVSPPIDVTLELLGKQKTLARIESGLLFMSKEREKPEIIRHIVDEKV